MKKVRPSSVVLASQPGGTATARMSKAGEAERRGSERGKDGERGSWLTGGLHRPLPRASSGAPPSTTPSSVFLLCVALCVALRQLYGGSCFPCASRLFLFGPGSFSRVPCAAVSHRESSRRVSLSVAVCSSRSQSLIESAVQSVSSASCNWHRKGRVVGGGGNFLSTCREGRDEAAAHTRHPVPGRAQPTAPPCHRPARPGSWLSSELGAARAKQPGSSTPLRSAPHVE